ncbi:hypothetical protein ACA910_012266 [Epithemia clementina (nom. ined.)]
MEALRPRGGFQVCMVEQQTGVPDFCVALSATSALVGLYGSTLAVMAGILGNATKVRLFQVSKTPLSLEGDEQPALLKETLVLIPPKNQPSGNKSDDGLIYLRQDPRQNSEFLEGRQFSFEWYCRRERITSDQLF